MSLANIVLNNKTGNSFYIYMNLFVLTIGLLIQLNGQYSFFLFGLIFFLISIIFFFKKVKISESKIEFYYFLRPFWRKKVVDIRDVKKVQFSLLSSGKMYPNIAFIIKKTPYYVEVRLDKNDDVLEIVKIMCTYGTFTIKPLSDKNIMRERLNEILQNSSCKIV